MTKVCESVHFLNLLYDRKDYANFENAFSIINEPQLDSRLIPH